MQTQQSGYGKKTSFIYVVQKSKSKQRKGQTTTLTEQSRKIQKTKWSTNQDEARGDSGRIANNMRREAWGLNKDFITQELIN